MSSILVFKMHSLHNALAFQDTLKQPALLIWILRQILMRSLFSKLRLHVQTLPPEYPAMCLVPLLHYTEHLCTKFYITLAGASQPKICIVLRKHLSSPFPSDMS
jgi:hypothetical protein